MLLKRRAVASETGDAGCPRHESQVHLDELAPGRGHMRNVSGISARGQDVIGTDGVSCAVPAVARVAEPERASRCLQVGRWRPGQRSARRRILRPRKARPFRSTALGHALHGRSSAGMAIDDETVCLVFVSWAQGSLQGSHPRNCLCERRVRWCCRAAGSSGHTCAGATGFARFAARLQRFFR